MDSEKAVATAPQGQMTDYFAGQAVLPRGFRRIRRVGHSILRILAHRPPGVALDQATQLVLGGLIIAELLLATAVALEAIRLATLLALHIAGVAIAAAALHRAGTGDRTFQAIGILTVLFAGPLGAIGFLAMILAIDRVPVSSDLNAWYQRLSGNKKADPAAELHEAIVNGRAIQVAATTIPVFTSVLVEGSLPQSQALLGLIGRKYHPDYYPVLRLALRSPEASVRAQAAAVFAKLKDQHKARLNRSLGEDASADDAREDSVGCSLQRVHEIMTCIDSGFIDSPEAARARAVARALCEEALEGQTHSIEGELLLYRLLAADGEHDAVRKRFEQRGDAAPAELRNLFVQSLIRLKRHRELRRYCARPEHATTPG
jgi:hypothetical protein